MTKPEPVFRAAEDVLWWKRGIIYQIYPRSFQDTDGDGIGDLNGIRHRLDYLSWLGVDGIWITPVYPSPMADFGYDVADHCDIDPLFGTLEDFDRLLAEAHRLGLRVVLDFVPNHTSVEHPWFRESRASEDSPRRDWYIWRDGRDGGPPNNWISNFGGPAWTRDSATGQYYLHSFLKEQPDLNWRNPAVREAMYDVLRFWLDRGIDGFRVDVIWLLIKDEALRDNPVNPAYDAAEAEIQKLLQRYSADQPEVHDVVAEMRRVIDEYGDNRVLIGEIYLPLERLVTYYGRDQPGAHLPFNFQLIQTAWNAQDIAALIREYEEALPEHGWPNWVLGNHDQPRIAARVGKDQARLAAMLLLTLRGTPTMYYGDEVGMQRVEIGPEEVQDPWETREGGLGLGRDPSRTPMQWSSGPGAGFTKTGPWLPLAQDHQTCNVETLRGDSRSILSLYRLLITLRHSRRALTVGLYGHVGTAEDVLIYERFDGADRVLVALNFSDCPRRIRAPEQGRALRVLVSTALDRNEERAEIELRPHEGIVADILG